MRYSRYDVAGPPDAPAIALVHGTRLSRAVWAPQVARLAREFCVVMPDLPGHGALADVPFTLAGAADALAEVIDEAAGGRAVVVGHSLGGYVAMELAARSPERVAGLVLAGASREPVGPWSLPYRWLALLLRVGNRPAFDGANARFFRWRFGPAISEPIVAGGFWPRGGAAALAALMGERFVPRLARYPGPTLIVNGALDPLFRLGERAFLAAAQDGRREVIPRATHMLNLDRPAAFNEAVRRFAADVYAASNQAG
ncbi:MAG: alpha/beta hydrolase [Chloroflexota bacterium]|nr:alpha/beta hydrolase [Chloroflexota bacterium]